MIFRHKLVRTERHDLRRDRVAARVGRHTDAVRTGRQRNEAEVLGVHVQHRLIHTTAQSVRQVALQQMQKSISQHKKRGESE